MSKTKNSLMTSGRLLTLLSTAALLWPAPLKADSTKQMNLSEMCGRADKIFRGAVINATPGTVRIAGIELPTVTYRIRVDEAFKGEFQLIKGVRFTEVRMLGSLKSKMAGQTRIVTQIIGLPQLEVGQSYLLLTTRPSSVGMSSPVGLGQGCFHLSGRGNSEAAVNEAGNKMLFKGMESEAQETSGPVKYSHLAQRIRGLVNSQRSER